MRQRTRCLPDPDCRSTHSDHQKQTVRRIQAHRLRNKSRVGFIKRALTGIGDEKNEVDVLPAPRYEFDIIPRQEAPKIFQALFARIDSHEIFNHGTVIIGLAIRDERNNLPAPDPANLLRKSTANDHNQPLLV